MATYSKPELKRMAKIVMFNPQSDKAQELIWAVAQRARIMPQDALNRIASLALG